MAGQPTYRLLSAMLGGLGLDLARQHRPDVILLDLNLPDMSGGDVLRHLRDDPRTRDIPVIVISADATRDHVEKLLAAGARAYLTKPLDIRELLEVVYETLKERRLDQTG
jgi:CheY-like chemotaxis protein